MSDAGSIPATSTNKQIGRPGGALFVWPWRAEPVPSPLSWLPTASLKALSGLHEERLDILAQNRGRHQQRSMVETGD